MYSSKEVEASLWEVFEGGDQRTCVGGTDQSATSTSQIHCQSLCENDASCIGIGCDMYYGCTEKCFTCQSGDLEFSPDIAFYNKTETISSFF